MSSVLAIDCSTDICSIALHHLGHISSLSSDTARQHARETLPMVHRLLEQAGLELPQLDAVAFTSGPGSFTGLRIGTAIAQGLAFAHNLPVIPVSSLAAMACQLREEALQAAHAKICVALYARDAEVYWGSFIPAAVDAEGGIYLQGHERVLSVSKVAELLPEGGPWVAVGDGWTKDETLAALAVGARHYAFSVTSNAEALASIAVQALAAGRCIPAEEALPVYLKEQEYRQS